MEMVRESRILKLSAIFLLLMVAGYASAALDPETQSRVDALVNELITTGRLQTLPQDLIKPFLKALIDNPKVPPGAMKLKTMNPNTGEYDYWTPKQFLSFRYPEYYYADDDDYEEDWPEPDNQGGGNHGGGGGGHGGGGPDMGSMMAMMKMFMDMMKEMGGGMGAPVGGLDDFVKQLSGFTMTELNQMAGDNSTVLQEADMQKVAELARLTTVSKKLATLSQKPVGKYCLCV